MVNFESYDHLVRYHKFCDNFPGVRRPPADFLRNQCQKILTRMLRQASQRTKRYLIEMVKTIELQELVDFFHAFLAFCVDPSSLLSPLSKFFHHALVAF